MSLLKTRKTITVEKLFKDSQNRPITELFKFSSGLLHHFAEIWINQNLKSIQNCIKYRKVDL
jgi:hypothetical protein